MIQGLTILLILLTIQGCSNSSSSRRDSTSESVSSDTGAEDQSVVTASGARFPVPVAGVNVADISRVEIVSTCLVGDCSKKLYRPNVLMKSGKSYLVVSETAKKIGVSNIEWRIPSRSASCSDNTLDKYSRTCHGAAGTPLALSLSVALTFVSGGSPVVGSLSNDRSPSGSPSKLYLAYGVGLTNGLITANDGTFVLDGLTAADYRCADHNDFVARVNPDRVVKWFSFLWSFETSLAQRLATKGMTGIVSDALDIRMVVTAAPTYFYHQVSGTEVQESLVAQSGTYLNAALLGSIDANISDFNGILPGSTTTVWMGQGCGNWANGIDGNGKSATFDGSGGATIQDMTCANAFKLLCMAAIY